MTENIRHQANCCGTSEQNSSACCSCVPVTFDREKVASQAKVLAALADPTRLQIVEMLARLDDQMCVCDIGTPFNLGQPTISHHLKVLRDARLVNWEKRGLWVYYSLNRETVGQIAAHLGGLLKAGREPVAAG
jgi:ArsR family transcriptional regulator